MESKTKLPMIKLVGIPFDSNSSFLRGSFLGPARIRLMEKDGSSNAFTENEIEIKEGLNYIDAGDLTFEDTNSEKAFYNIKNKISALLKDKSKILSIGGDHSISYPIITAFAEIYKDLNILQLDAHGDLYDNFDNNPYSHASPFARIMEMNKINSLTQVGIRALTPHQRIQSKRFGIDVIDMKDFSDSFIKRLKSPLYISLDIDVLDPAFAPGVSHHEPGGMTSRQLLNIIQNIDATIVGADIVEFNPIRDINNMTAMVGYKLMKELIAKMV